MGKDLKELMIDEVKYYFWLDKSYQYHLTISSREAIEFYARYLKGLYDQDFLRKYNELRDRSNKLD